VKSAEGVACPTHNMLTRVANNITTLV